MTASALEEGAAVYASASPHAVDHGGGPQPFGGDHHKWLTELAHARRVYSQAPPCEDLRPAHLPAGHAEHDALPYPRELTPTGWIRWRPAHDTTRPQAARPVEIAVIHPAWHWGLRQLVIRSVWGRRPTALVDLGRWAPPVPVARFIVGMSIAALGVVYGLATLHGMIGLNVGLLAGAMVTHVIPATLRRLTRSRIRIVNDTAPGVTWLWHLTAADRALLHTHPGVMNGPALLWHAAHLATLDTDQARSTLTHYLDAYRHVYAGSTGAHRTA